MLRHITSKDSPMQQRNHSLLSVRSSSQSSVGSAESKESDEVYSKFFQDQKFITYPLRYKVSLSLTSREVDLIRTTWQQMLTDSKTAETNLTQQSFSSASFASSLFCHQLYDNLLDMKPELIEMFPSIKHQAVSFAGIMNITINSLENLSSLNSVLEHLGRIHSRILGIDGPFFELMGDALIKTLQDRFVKSDMDFTIELEDCWIKLYCFLANSILQSGIDPILQYDNSLHRSKSSSSSSSLNTDQETLLDEKFIRPPPIANGKGSPSSSPVKKTTMGSTRQAIRNFTHTSSSSSRSSSSSVPKLKVASKQKKGDKKKDDTCIVM